MEKSRIKWLLNICEGYKKKIFFSLVLNIIAVTLSLVFVEITQILLNGEVETLNRGGLLLVALVFTKLFQIGCESYETSLRQTTCSRMRNSISQRLFASLFQSQIKDERSLHSGDEINRLTTDVRVAARSITDTIPVCIYALIQLIATCSYLLTIQANLTLMVVFIMPLVLLIGQQYTKKIIPISREIRKRDSRIISFMQEHLLHHELISTLGLNLFVSKQLKELQDKLFNKTKLSIYLDVFADALIEIGFAAGFLTVFIWGVYGITHGTFTYAKLVVFMQLIGQLQRPFIMFKVQYPDLVNSFVSVERLIEIEKLPKEESGEKQKLSGAIGVDFSNVCFKYSDDARWIHKNFCHTFKPRSITAIVGETGVGKSTLVRLILSVLLPNSGIITLFDENKRYRASPLTRGNCIYVPQGNSIISGTIRYNLQLGKQDATDEEMKDALYSSAAEFVMNDFPNGLDTLLGEGGLGISEGQAQRIAIARSFLQEGGLILMDEPTSALDADTEKLFIERLVKCAQNKTIIIITHKQEIRKYVSNVVLIAP